MKLFGLIAVLAFLATSCEKEHLCPVDHTAPAVVTAKTPDNSGTTTVTPTGNEGGGITDPNNDPAGDKKKGR